jgi:uncharacterized protein
MGNPVLFFEILATDQTKVQDFYSGLFGWNINRDNPNKYGFVNTNSEKGIQGGIGHAELTGKNKVMVYAEVDNLETYIEKAKALGGSVIMPPTMLIGYSIAMISDPEGNVTGLILPQRPNTK